MNPLQIVLLVLVLAVVVFAIWTATRRSREERHNAQAQPLRDPNDCSHEWEMYEAGTCTTSYSSYGGCDPQETWVRERCTLCGTERLVCPETCDCYNECISRGA